MPAGGSEHLAIGGWIRIIFGITVYQFKLKLILLASLSASQNVCKYGSASPRGHNKNDHFLAVEPRHYGVTHIRLIAWSPAASISSLILK
jgi:hypothetical protein